MPKFPIRVNSLVAPEVLMRPSLGASMLQEHVLAMWGRQLPWLHLVANHPGLVGAVHRLVACQHDVWQEPTVALASAQEAVGWRVRRDGLPAYTGLAYNAPRAVVSRAHGAASMDCFTEPGAVSRVGGAVEVKMDEEVVRTAWISLPNSILHLSS